MLLILNINFDVVIYVKLDFFTINNVCISMNSYMQKAIKQKNLNLWDLEKDVLGTEREQKTPPGSGR